MQITVNKMLNAARILINSRWFWGTLRTLENMLEDPNTIFLKSAKKKGQAVQSQYKYTQMTINNHVIILNVINIFFSNVETVQIHTLRQGGVKTWVEHDYFANRCSIAEIMFLKIKFVFGILFWEQNVP